MRTKSLSLTRAYFCMNTGEYQCFEIFCPKTSCCAGKPIYWQLNINQSMYVSIFTKTVRGSEGEPKSLNLLRGFVCLKTAEFKCYEVCCSETTLSQKLNKILYLKRNQCLDQMIELNYTFLMIMIEEILMTSWQLSSQCLQ